MDYQKWLTKLLGYDFEIIYKAGVDNKVADGLSLLVFDQSFSVMELFTAITQVSNLQMQDIFEEIDADAHIQQTLHNLLVGSCEKPGFIVKKVVL